MDKLKNFILRHFRRCDFPSIIFILIAILGLASMMMILSYIIGDNSSFKLRALLYLSDSALLLCFYWFCSPRLRCLSFPVVWIIALFLLANSLYSHYWGDLIPLSSVFIANNYNQFLLNSIPAVFAWYDSAFLLIPASITFAFIALKPYKAPPFIPSAKGLCLIATILFYALGFYISTDSIRRWHQKSGYPDIPFSTVIANRFGRDSAQFGMWRNNGFCGFIITQMINYPHKEPIALDSGSRRSLQNFIDMKSDEACDSTVLTDNHGKNLIFIIVESLNAWTIGKRYGEHLLTPVLSSLIGSPGCVSSVSMLPQINDGGSSDGQLIYNTGLLPLINGVAAQTYADNVFPSLNSMLRHASSAEFIVENARVYNHRRTSTAFGYDNIHDEDSLLAASLDPADIGYDEAVLSYAFDRISKMPQPFLAEITTLSMHYPFDYIGIEPVSWIDSVAPGNYYLTHYLQTVHYTDAAIGSFLSKLKASPLADNTIVVIASDHDEFTAQRKNSETSDIDYPIVFIATGTGITKNVDIPMGQIDVFPTILDIMGADKAQAPWRGLGTSILSDKLKAAVSRTGRLYGDADSLREAALRRSFTVSDSIIRSDFFAQ